MERRQEARNPFYRVVELTDETEDAEAWGKNFPLQYDGYRRTVDQVRTRYGGSEAEPRTPTEVDPRSVVAQSRLEEDPRLKQMWAGYAFATDFREERGHAYMLDDQTFTERQQVTQQPGTCIHCHGSVYVPYKKLGGGDLVRGFEQMNQMKFQGRPFRMRNLALDALVGLVNDIKAARDAGRADAELHAARDFQRKAQFYLDFVEAENSTGFHAGQEAVRILGESINFSRMGQVALRGGGVRPAPATPSPAGLTHTAPGR